MGVSVTLICWPDAGSEDLLEHKNNGRKTQQNSPHQKLALENGLETVDKCFHHISIYGFWRYKVVWLLFFTAANWA